ncbi:nitrate ABC transporter substrate-binding protein, partial [Thermodesulfobacteriota bacterium]
MVERSVESAISFVKTNGSEEALKKVLAGQVDVAVLWEPDVSRALAEPEIVKLLGTEDTNKLIVDVLMVSRDFSEDHPEIVHALLTNYFKT